MAEMMKEEVPLGENRAGVQAVDCSTSNTVHVGEIIKMPAEEKHDEVKEKCQESSRKKKGNVDEKQGSDVREGSGLTKTQIPLVLKFKSQR